MLTSFKISGIVIKSFRNGKPFRAVGVYDGEGPPVPIPNTVVKLISAENTWREAAREDRSAPTYIFSSIAQSVEHAAVNRRVVGSSPTWGAIYITIRTLRA